MICPQVVNSLAQGFPKDCGQSVRPIPELGVNKLNAQTGLHPSFYFLSVWSRPPRMAWRMGQDRLWLLKVLLMGLCLVFTTAEDPRECREQEYKDWSGNCVACKQCDSGEELSKECGFGYGEDARCVPCRPGRFKEDRGLQKCKPCLDCALINRFQKANCSTTRNALCGDCLAGFYRKTKLSGFQDMECIPCGDSPPPYEPHCSSRVNQVPLQSPVTSPRDVALAAVICSALASVLLALFILCIIYCKRQLLEKKPNALVRAQDGPYSGAELLCFDRRQIHELPNQDYCHCKQGPGHTCTGSALISSLCCDETCSLGHSPDACPFQSKGDLNDGRLLNPLEGDVPGSLGLLRDSLGMDSTETRPLMQDSPRPEGPDGSQYDQGMSETDTEQSGAEGKPAGPNDHDQDHSCLMETSLHPKQPPPSSQG
ncbi:hypothetical protein AGOR_G00123720 [Albula goreensis]|uniref:TNFR-Cys domain-containing protein n=1 Tax=Albula goreensis TaxID=1534307 RepID=A0A8T3DD40_9TELE|nr:hypothetical protein AGOR_G00123720 [Albula goreensis]